MDAMKSIYSPSYRSLLTWLRACRMAQHLSMRDLGKRMGMPHSWISKVETGERRLDVEEYVRLCLALGIQAEQGVTILRTALPANLAYEAYPGLAATVKTAKYRVK
jgi:transcriptional regulator with XRE-family HTH domain